MTITEQFIVDAFNVCLGRPPSPTELASHVAHAEKVRSVSEVVAGVVTLSGCRTRWPDVFAAIERPVTPPTPASLEDSAAYQVDSSVPLPVVLAIGSIKTIPVRVTNTGTRTWNESERHLGVTYHWTLPDGSPVEWDYNPRALLPLNSLVPPGDGLTVLVDIKPPARGPGRYICAWDMIIYQGAYFSTTGSPMGRLEVQVV